MDPYNSNNNIFADSKPRRSSKKLAVLIAVGVFVVLGFGVVGSYALFWAPKKTDSSQASTPSDDTMKADNKPLPGQTYVEQMTLSDGRQVYVQKVAH